MMMRTLGILGLAIGLTVGCGSEENGDDNDSEPVETLTPEPAGAPSETVDGRWTCLGAEAGGPSGAAIELVGYVRTLSDPTASADPPAAELEAFTSSGTALDSAFSDPSKAGRVALSVPVTSKGFDGYTVTSITGYLDWRMHTSRPVTDTSQAGWAWMTTQAEADTQASNLSITLDAGKGILVGVVHDCDGFGAQFSVVEVQGDTGSVYYVEGFDVVSSRTYTSSTGRFALANVEPGTVTVKAFGRLESGGPLTLLSTATAGVEAGRMTAVAMEPRLVSK